MQDHTPGFKRTSSINFCIFSVCCIDTDIFYVILLKNQKIGTEVAHICGGGCMTVKALTPSMQTQVRLEKQQSG
jgi:hypothetical protein